MALKSQPENIGAAAALKWLSEQVAQGEKDLAKLKIALDKAIEDERDNPPEKDGADFARLRSTARTNYDDAFDLQFKLLTKLGQFDKSVEPAKRDASESITRTEGEKVFTMMAIYLRTANTQFLTAAIPQIRECKSNEEAYRVAEGIFGDSLAQSIKSAVGNANLPAWTLACVEGIL